MNLRASLFAFTLTLAALAVPNAALALPASEVSLDDRISIELKNAAPAEVFKSFGQITGMEAVVDPALHRKLSVGLQNVRVRTALNVACESLDCRWEVEDGKLVITALPGGDRKAAAKPGTAEPIDLRVTEADVPDLLRTFGQMLSADVVLDPAISGKISLNLTKTPWGQALDTVCKQAGCAWSLSGGEKGEKKVLRVTKR